MCGTFDLLETHEEDALVEGQAEPVQLVRSNGVLLAHVLPVGLGRHAPRRILQSVALAVEGLPRAPDEFLAQAVLHYPAGLLLAHAARALLPEGQG